MGLFALELNEEADGIFKFDLGSDLGPGLEFLQVLNNRILLLLLSLLLLDFLILSKRIQQPVKYSIAHIHRQLMGASRRLLERTVGSK